MADKDRTEALLSWYGRHRRDIAWRSTSDPWAILVSEVMAQQTQVTRVIPKWRSFMTRFPTPADCAAAPRAAVVAMWSGLGYNTRAVRLHAAASRVTADGWPTTTEGLAALPGVGPYTAAAVACFAFGEQVPTVDTNFRRVLSRWAGRALDGAALWERARDELPDGAAVDWNQAVMDLGASLCTPRDPSCDTCPVASWCADPTIYQPPRPQGRFEGSRREARGAVIRVLSTGPASAADISATESIADGRIRQALAHLQDEGLITRSEGCWTLT